MNKRRNSNMTELGFDTNKKQLDFGGDVKIDKFSLDTECLDQPRRFKKWSDLLADAIKDQKVAERRYRVAKAEALMEIRRKDGKDISRYSFKKDKTFRYSLDKLTDAVVAAAVECHPNVVAADLERAECEHSVGILFGAKDAMKDRREELKNLVSLFLSGYWAEPRIKSSDQEELVDAATSKQKEELHERMSRRQRPK